MILWSIDVALTEYSSSFSLISSRFVYNKAFLSYTHHDDDNDDDDDVERVASCPTFPLA